MTDELEILNAALKQAAAASGQSVHSLTEDILRGWLIGHGFLGHPVGNVTGAAAIIVGDLDPIDVTRLTRRRY
jgi:hypothetical protein